MATTQTQTYRNPQTGQVISSSSSTSTSGVIQKNGQTYIPRQSTTAIKIVEIPGQTYKNPQTGAVYSTPATKGTSITIYGKGGGGGSSTQVSAPTIAGGGTAPMFQTPSTSISTMSASANKAVAALQPQNTLSYQVGRVNVQTNPQGVLYPQMVGLSLGQFGLTSTPKDTSTISSRYQQQVMSQGVLAQPLALVGFGFSELGRTFIGTQPASLYDIPSYRIRGSISPEQSTMSLLSPYESQKISFERTTYAPQAFSSSVLITGGLATGYLAPISLTASATAGTLSEIYMGESASRFIQPRTQDMTLGQKTGYYGMGALGLGLGYFGVKTSYEMGQLKSLESRPFMQRTIIGASTEEGTMPFRQVAIRGFESPGSPFFISTTGTKARQLIAGEGLITPIDNWYAIKGKGASVVQYTTPTGNLKYIKEAFPFSSSIQEADARFVKTSFGLNIQKDIESAYKGVINIKGTKGISISKFAGYSAQDLGEGNKLLISGGIERQGRLYDFTRVEGMFIPRGNTYGVLKPTTATFYSESPISKETTFNIFPIGKQAQVSMSSFASETSFPRVQTMGGFNIASGSYRGELIPIARGFSDVSSGFARPFSLIIPSGQITTQRQISRQVQLYSPTSKNLIGNGIIQTQGLLIKQTDLFAQPSGQFQTPTQIIKQSQLFAQPSMQTQKISTTTFNPIPFEFPVIIPPFGFNFPAIDWGKRSRTYKSKQKKKYTPDLLALTFNIKGKAPKGSVGLRPIPKGFTWRFK